MKSEKWISGLIALALSTAVALGGVGCIVTGFGLEPEDFVHLIWMVMGVAAVSTLCLSARLGELLLTVLMLLGIGYGVRHSELLLSLEKLLNHITFYYHNAYNWPYIRWSSENLRWADPDLALQLMASLSAMATNWVILRKQWFGCAILPGLLPLILCSIVTDTVPTDGWLWLLLTALLLLTMTQLPRRTDARNANRLTALLLVPVLLFSWFLFCRTSADTLREPAQALQQQLLTLLGHAADPEGTGTGPGGPVTDPPTIADTVDLSALDGFHPGDGTALTITASDFSGLLYLRGQAYDVYTGQSWETAAPLADRGWPVQGLAPWGSITIKTAAALPLQYFPYYTTFPIWAEQLQNGYLPNPDGATTYTLDLYLDKNRSPIQSLTERSRYTALPEQTRTEAQAFLLQNGIHQDLIASESQLVNLIVRYVENCAAYDPSTGAMPAGAEDFALWFLEESDTGYCVHFATAATVLLRAMGIPARYVTGYVTQVTAGAECAVPEYQAHAWVEYYNSIHGWTLLDPTPAEPVAPIILTPAPTEPTETTQPTETTVPTETTAPTETTQPTETTAPTATTEATNPAVSNPTEAATASTESTRPAVTAPAPSLWEQLNLKWIRGLLWIAALWLLLGGQYKLRLKLRKYRMHRGTPNQQAICRWRHVRRIARVSGLTAGSLLPLAEKAAFSQHQLTEAELARFDAWFPKANQKLLEKPWLVQFFLRLIFAVE